MPRGLAELIVPLEKEQGQSIHCEREVDTENSGDQQRLFLNLRDESWTACMCEETTKA